MSFAKEISDLKKYIEKAYQSTYAKISPNIFRGHLRAISADIENGIAMFTASILPQHKLFLDVSIHVGGKNNRPDLLIINERNEVVAMVEIKANMGYCRNAQAVIDNIIANNNQFRDKGTLECEFSREERQTVSYKDNVKLFLISLTEQNCTASNHASNKFYAASKGVKQFNLFSGWYENLSDCEISQYASELQNIAQGLID